MGSYALDGPLRGEPFAWRAGEPPPAALTDLIQPARPVEIERTADSVRVVLSDLVPDEPAWRAALALVERLRPPPAAPYR